MAGPDMLQEGGCATDFNQQTSMLQVTCMLQCMMYKCSASVKPSSHQQHSTCSSKPAVSDVEHWLCIRVPIASGLRSDNYCSQRLQKELLQHARLQSEPRELSECACVSNCTCNTGNLGGPSLCQVNTPTRQSAAYMRLTCMPTWSQGMQWRIHEQVSVSFAQSQ